MIKKIINGLHVVLFILFFTPIACVIMLALVSQRVVIGAADGYRDFVNYDFGVFSKIPSAAIDSIKECRAPNYKVFWEKY